MERVQVNQSKTGTAGVCPSKAVAKPKSYSVMRTSGARAIVTRNTAGRWRFPWIASGVVSLVAAHVLLGAAHANGAPESLLLAQATTSTTSTVITSVDNSAQMARTRQQIEADHREIDSMAERIKEMIKARYHADALYAEAQVTIEQLRQKIALLEQRLKDASVGQQALIAERDGLLEQLELMTDERNNARGDINVLAGEIDTQRNTVDALRAEVAAAAEQLDEREKQVATLTDKTESQRNTGDLLQENLSATEDKLRDKGRQLALASERLADAKQQLGNLRGELSELKTDRNNALNEIANLRLQRDTADQRSNNLLAEKQNLSGKLGLFEARSDDVNNALLAEQQHHAETRENVKSMQKVVAGLQGDVEKAIAERDDLIVQKAALENEKANLQGSLDKTNGKLKVANRDLQNRQAELQTASNEYEDVSGKLAAAKAELEDLNSQLASAQDEIGMLNARIGKLDSKVADLLANRDNAQASISELTSNGTTLKQQLEAAKVQTATKLASAQTDLKKQKSALQSKIDRRDKDLLQLNGRVSELTANLDELKSNSEAQIEGRDARISALESQLAKLESTRNQLQREGSRATETLQNLHNLIASMEDKEKESAEKLRKLHGAIAGVQNEGDKKAADLQRRLDEAEQQLKVATNELNALLSDKSAVEAERDAILSEAEQLRISLTDQLNAAQLENVTVQDARPDNSIPLRLGNADFFAPGSAELTKEGGENLKKLAEIISTFDDRRIVVEGHTDNVRIGYRLKSIYYSNWELSVARAAAAVRHMQYQSNIDPTQLSAVGYGEYAPVADNDTADGRQLNRRVEVVLYPSIVREQQFSAIDE